ncbi:hypothetical protein, partial [Zestomonas carbonaria]|uniref:hypothetical protein n=1 Tax=Zestomonas carbonaria TaxID=2762745 RepID=UPI001B35627E
WPESRSGAASATRQDACQVPLFRVKVHLNQLVIEDHRIVFAGPKGEKGRFFGVERAIFGSVARKSLIHKG